MPINNKSLMYHVDEVTFFTKRNAYNHLLKGEWIAAKRRWIHFCHFFMMQEFNSFRDKKCNRRPTSIAIIRHLQSKSFYHVLSVNVISVTRLGDLLDNFLKPLATINLSKSLAFLCNFCKDVKICHFSSEIIFRQLL